MYKLLYGVVSLASVVGPRASDCMGLAGGGAGGALCQVPMSSHAFSLAWGCRPWFLDWQVTGIAALEDSVLEMVIIQHTRFQT